MIIKNRDILATTNPRSQVLDIIEAGISRVLPGNIMMSAVRYDSLQRLITINNDTFSTGTGRIFLIGGGKASGLMAEALENIVGIENIAAGVVNCKGGHPKTGKIKIITAGHPIPNQQGIYGVEEMLALKHRYSICENDLIICLISGGGSALMPCPVAEVSLKDKQITTESLISSGAEIGEINILRKHLSRIKGGQLGNFYSPATVISLILSDVIGNDLAVIASGPTSPDPSTFSDAYEVLKRYHLLSKVPKNAAAFLRKGCRGDVAETPKALNNCHNYLIGDNRLAVEAMFSKAREMGLTPHIVTSQQKGNTTEAALLRANEVLNKRYAEYNILLIGGETTIKLPAFAGKGGRNQHYAAVSMKEMAPYPGEWVVASIGTDGSDFLPDVAGAIVDQSSIDIAQAKGIDVASYLERCDSNTLLDLIGNSLIITGDTGTNVGDIMVYLTV
ncbi:glycerate kinase [Chloroflexota bacterium]